MYGGLYRPIVVVYILISRTSPLEGNRVCLYKRYTGWVKSFFIQAFWALPGNRLYTGIGLMAAKFGDPHMATYCADRDCRDLVLVRGTHYRMAEHAA